MFVLGTQYLRGASPEKDQWKRDLENIKNYGFNTVRAWLVWNAIELDEGKINYEYINDFLSIAEENELKVGLLFHMHACPAWAVKKYSKYFYVDEDNLPFEPGDRPNTPSGGWPGLCFDNPEVRDMEERYFEAVIKETKKHDCVAFYEPMNEPHQWVNMYKGRFGTFCYCDASLKKFRLWLKKKYGDIKTLCKAWGKYYNSFDEVRPPRWCGSFSDYIDFRQFNIDNIAEEVEFRTGIIKKCDTKPVVAHAWGGGTVTCANIGGMAFDDWKNASKVDKWGYSAFPQTANDCVSLGLGCDSTRCVANGKEFWQSELTAGIRGMGTEQHGRIDDNTFDKFSLESIRHGASGLLYWQYRKERFGSEWGGFALTDYDGGPNNLILKASSLAKVISANDDVFGNIVQDNAEVGIVFSMRSYLADWCGSDRSSNKYSVDSMSGYYKMFWEENIKTDIIHEEFSTDLSRYKILIIPVSFAVTEEFAERLKHYVYNGGILISEPYFGAFDKDCKCSYAVPGYGFDKIFGCREDDLTQKEECDLFSDKNKIHIAGNKYFETFKNITGDVLYRSQDGHPVIISNKYGKGRAVLSGVSLGLSYSSRVLVSDDIISSDKGNSGSESKKIIMDIISGLKIKGNICSAEGVKVSILEGKNKNADIVVIINSTNEKKDGIIQIKNKYTDIRCIYGEADCSANNNGLKFKIMPNKSAIIRLELYK